MTGAPAAAQPGGDHDRVTIDLGARSYDVVVGSGALAAAGGLMRPVLAQDRVFVVTDETVAGLHLATLTAGLDAAGITAQDIVVAPGEATKCFAELEALTGRLLEAGIERGSTLVALGGGVIGDLVGFAASVILRGIDFVQIPTTLLAQVDSSVGGKTGINTAQGKNLVGAFHQPRLVIADTGVLDTLPARELRAGYAEVAKYGIIDDAAFFAWLEANGAALLQGDPAARRHAITTCCRAKAAIVARDEREAGARALLNLGHTFGHALEAETGYGTALLHGEAVALGMVMAMDLSAELGLCLPADAARVRRHLDAMGLPTSLGALDRPFETAALLAHMARDKKVRDGKITLILSRGIGDAFASTDTPEAALRGLLDRAVAA